MIEPKKQVPLNIVNKLFQEKVKTAYFINESLDKLNWHFSQNFKNLDLWGLRLQKILLKLVIRTKL